MSINYTNIIGAAELMKRIASSHGYDWANRNDDLIPFKFELEPKLRRDLKSMDIDQVGDVSEAIYTICDWNKYKKIYELQPTFADYLADTESAKVSCELWKRLPYESFYLYFGDRQLHAIQYGISSITMKTVGGAFVRVHIEQNNTITLGVELYGDEGQEKWIGFALNVPDGLNFDEAIDYYIESRKGKETFDENRVNEVKAFWRPFFRIVMNACQYFSASNAEIKDMKIPKKDRPISKSKNGKEKKINIQISQVGYSIGKRFEQLYQQSESNTMRTGIKGIKKRPHVRRAHWHHYWTGPGRTVLEVKWLEPVFVMANNDMNAVVHQVKGE